jgi:nucleotide-binding universal stress UspA family protein
MFNHILVPIDGSETSMLAVSKASGLALAFGSRITLIHVIDNYPFIGVGADYALGQNEYLAAATAGARTAPTVCRPWRPRACTATSAWSTATSCTRASSTPPSAWAPTSS